MELNDENYNPEAGKRLILVHCFTALELPIDRRFD